MFSRPRVRCPWVRVGRDDNPRTNATLRVAVLYLRQRDQPSQFRVVFSRHGSFFIFVDEDGLGFGIGLRKALHAGTYAR